MTMADKIKSRIAEGCTHFLFSYEGKDCGVDPLSDKEFDIWHGEELMEAHSIDEVMQTPFFDGKSLQEIATKIKITDW